MAGGSALLFRLLAAPDKPIVNVDLFVYALGPELLNSQSPEP